MAGLSNYAYRQLIRRLGGVGLPATEMIGRSFPADLTGVCHSLEPTAPGRQADLAPGCRAAKTGPIAARTAVGGQAGAAAAGGADLGQRPRYARGRGPPVGRGVPAERDRSELRLPVAHGGEKAESGSYLLRDPERIGRIVSRMAAACLPVPVTAKIRTGCTRDTINAIDVAQAIEGAGGAAVTVHGRTAEDLFRGSADWEEIARLKQRLGPDSADRQWRPVHCGRRGAGLRPLWRQRRDDRPRRARPALALPPGGRGAAGLAGAAGI